MRLLRVGVVAGILLAAVVGGLSLRAARDAAAERSSAAAGAALRTRVSRDDAVATARATAEGLFLRMDRAEAKLVTLAELGSDLGQDDWRMRPASPPIDAVWVVAIAGLTGDQSGCLLACTPKPGPPAWHVYSIDALSGNVFARNAGGTGFLAASPWPGYFEALPDHPSALVVTPPAPAPLVFESLALDVPRQTYTVDAARQVAKADPLPPRTIVERAGDPARLVAQVGEELLASDDAGKTWRRVTPDLGVRDVVDAGARVIVAGRDGVYASDDLARWTRATSGDGSGAFLASVTRLFVWRRDGRVVYLAASATGDPRRSAVLASTDGDTWRAITEIAGRAVFGAGDVPIIGVDAGSTTSDVVRVEGTDLSHLTPVVVSGGPPISALASDPRTGTLWSYTTTNYAAIVRRSLDGGRTWARADEGMWGQDLGGIFFVGGETFAISPVLCWWWDGSGWRRQEMRVDWKPGPVVQTAHAVFEFGSGGGPLYRLRP